MTDLYFWAQSLDNQAPDVIFKNGVELSDDESRQKLVSEIYEIPKSNIDVLPAGAGITIRYSYSKFVIEAIPTQKDEINRLAPIVIYGVLPNDFSEDWAEGVRNDIQNIVSNKLNRTLDDSVLKAIRDELSEILKYKNGSSAIQLFQPNPKFGYRFANGLNLLVDKFVRYWKSF
jgi:hypothetical protein